MSWWVFWGGKSTQHDVHLDLDSTRWLIRVQVWPSYDWQVVTMVIYSKYGHFCLQEVRFVSFVVFHDDMRDLHSGNTQISYLLRSRRALRCVFDAWIYDIPTQSISYTCVYTICSRHTEALSTSSASNALCGISYETPETLDMRSEHKPPPNPPKSHS